ncbi:lasso peptide biosynthesis B2 protein [Amycolatopsis halotolerans]|uniref:Lasso peptide biosynthesis B2 protein n=1 Tax=Amycolatopsis halotolerans TaxID=330083 RepID=A0ABV7QM10_9PSEU
MSQPSVVPRRIRLPLHRKLLPLLTVGVATVLIWLSPKHLCAILEFARRGARPATFDQARDARRAVVAISLRCAGDGCLLRSVATALLCRAHGAWPTWRTGVRTQPFSAHAWIEADGQVVDEIHPAGYFAPLLTVAPLTGEDKAE